MMEVDIACVGFGPATAGFLTTLTRAPELPLQVICYERAGDISFGVSGVATRARGIRASLPDLDIGQIPMAAPVKKEKVAWLHGQRAVELPYIPSFLHKRGGMVMSIGQFLQFVGGQLMTSGGVQIWPGSPVREAIVEDGRVCGVRLEEWDVRANLTVIADGPVGAVGRQIDAAFGTPEGHRREEWALGMKMVVDLREDVDLDPGTVLHTFGHPEPEIFGFLYAHPGRVATAGIFVPSWYRNPRRTSYPYLQRCMMHPYLWQHLRGGKLRSWGAKSLQESGRRGEPYLAGDGYARIGEGSGSTNVLTGSGVDEAWTTGVHLGEAVLELQQAGKPFTKSNLEATYVARRRASWVEQEARIAEKARDGFHRGMVPGLAGMALAGFSKGRLSIPGKPRPMPDVDGYRAKQWPPVPYDGQLLVSHQDALLLGGKVQAPPGPDHVKFRDPELCSECAAKLCIEMCSGQAITAAEDGGTPSFDREKCVHCGACWWNCASRNVTFEAGAGGLHSSEN
jgi:electron-transferring-flavoprotein dehydrogenase